MAFLFAGALWATTMASSYDGFLYATFLVAAIGALGLNLVMGTGGLVSIGNAAFLAVGATTAVVLDRADVPMGFALLAAVLVSSLVGAVVGVPALRIHGIYLALATFAAHFIIIYLVERYQIETVGDVGFYLSPRFGSSGTNTGYWSLVLTLFVGVVLVVSAFYTSGRTGRALRMVRDHAGAAPTLGISVARVKLAAFSLSSGMIGLAGALLVYLTGTFSAYTFTLHVAIAYIAMILIGGVDSEAGAVIGAAIVTALPRVSSDASTLLLGESVASQYGPQISQALYGIAIIGCILVSPNGIVGWFRQRQLRRDGEVVSESDRIPARLRPSEAIERDESEISAHNVS